MLSMDHYTYWKEGVAEGRAEGLAEGLAEGKAAGLAEGEARGKAAAKAEVILQMLRENVSLEMIAKFTNLTVEEINEMGKAHALI